MPVPRWMVQPVAAREVGEALARLATSEPPGGAGPAMSELAGPRAERMADLVRRTAAARGERRTVVELRLPGRAGTGMADGASLPSDGAARGTQTFDDWLAEQDFRR